MPWYTSPVSPDHLDGGQGPPVRLRDGAPFSLAVFLGVRLLLSLTAVLAVGTVSPPSSATAGGEVAALPGWHNAIDGTDRWDADWFERIAGGGYANDASAAFFPGYPLLIRATTWTTTLGEANAALLVADLSFLGALIVLFGLTRRYYPQDHARRTVVLIACFPASFFFLAPYSESPYLLASLLAFWWARDRRWGAAAIAGACAAATRSIGVLLVPALLVEAWRQGPEGRGRRLAWATAPLLGPLAYAAYWWGRVGDPLRPFHAQAAWLRTFQAFPITLGRALRLGLVGIGDPHGIYWTADLLLTADPRHPLPGSVACDPDLVPRLRRGDDPRDPVLPAARATAVVRAAALARRVPAVLGDGGAVPRSPVRRGHRDVPARLRCAFGGLHELGIRLLAQRQSAQLPTARPSVPGAGANTRGVRRTDPRPVAVIRSRSPCPRKRAASRR